MTEASPPSACRRTNNRFLDALAPRTAARCARLGRYVILRPGHALAHRGDPVADAYFPVRGAISEIEEGLDGGCTEVAAIGSEGVVGIEALLGVGTAPFRRTVEIPTEALVLSVAEAAALHEECADFNRLVHRYAAARLQAAGISIGCNARHDARSRLARWLLRLDDRAGCDHFELTHETIALMLGVRRPTVTRAIADLRAAGAIAVRRNAVRVADRVCLENLSCCCFPESRDLYDAVYGDGSAQIATISSM